MFTAQLSQVLTAGVRGRHQCVCGGWVGVEVVRESFLEEETPGRALADTRGFSGPRGWKTQEAVEAQEVPRRTAQVPPRSRCGRVCVLARACDGKPKEGAWQETRPDGGWCVMPRSLEFIPEATGSYGKGF